jgi:hypothetical protein
LDQIAHINTKFDDEQINLTAIKFLYQNHTIICGTGPEAERIPTYNGVIQGSVNSPWMFACYLEEFLYSNETTKKMCDDEKILAFADDLLMITSSWGDTRKAYKILQATMEPADLIFNPKKCEILTARNTNLPEDEGDWATDGESDEERKKPEAPADEEMKATEVIDVDAWTKTENPKQRNRFNNHWDKGKTQKAKDQPKTNSEVEK